MSLFRRLFTLASNRRDTRAAAAVHVLTTAVVMLTTSVAAAQQSAPGTRLRTPMVFPEPSPDDDGPVLIDPNGRRLVPPPDRRLPAPPREPNPSFTPSGVFPEEDSTSRSNVPGAIPPVRFPRDPFTPERSVTPRPRGEPLELPRSRIIPAMPAPGDYTAESLRRCQEEFRRRYGETDREIPPALKAEFLQWVLTRYHLTPYHQVHHTVGLPETPGEFPEYTFGDDVSTWNGALLAAMSYKYAVTRDPETLALIIELVEGLHFFQKVTGKRGLVARCVVQSPVPVLRANRAYQAPDGTIYHFRSDAAKGTYNQIALGYALMLMLVGDDLPPETQTRARHDLSEMVTHLLDHDYRITEADGKKTKYGDLRPLLGPISVPFNAQVAYTMVAAAATFPGPDLIAQKMIRKEFDRLRNRHHVYYENPLENALAPQLVGASPFIKGMNDRNHLMNAAYVGMMLELYSASRQGRDPDRRYLFEQGQSMAWTIQEIQTERNALCNFQWAGLVRDPVVFQSVVPRNVQGNALRQLDYLVATATEQIRRAPIDRFYAPGRKIETREPQWVDAQRPDEVYFWKAGAMNRWEITGPPSNLLTCGIDYLHAYWLMRYFRLADE